MEIKVNDSMIIDIEEYIKDLSPELQEKARKCKTFKELTDLAEENDIPLPDEAVENVAGGAAKVMHKCGCNKTEPYYHNWVLLQNPKYPDHPYQCTYCGAYTQRPF